MKKTLQETVDRMRELAGLEELNVQQKKPVGNGDYHAIYPMKTDPDKVIKIGHDGADTDGDTQHVAIDPEHIKVFQENPDLFPIIYKTNGRWAIIERLYTDQIHEDCAVMEADFKKHGFHNGYNPLAKIFYLGEGGILTTFINTLPSGQLIAKYAEFFKRVRAWRDGYSWHPNRSFDFHQHQMGYTKDGRLKLLDF